MECTDQIRLTCMGMPCLLVSQNHIWSGVILTTLQDRQAPLFLDVGLYNIIINSVPENHRTHQTFLMARPKYLMRHFTNLNRILKAHRTNESWKFFRYTESMVLKSEYSRLFRSTPLLLMSWIQASPHHQIDFARWTGGRLNKKDGLTRYGDSHVKDKTS